MQEILDRLYRYGGMDRGTFAGTQFDIMQTIQHLPSGKVRDRSMCEHICRKFVWIPDHEARKAGKVGAMKKVLTGGCYACGAAATSNKNLDASSLVPLELLIEWMKKEAAAQKIFHELFMGEPFRQYCEEFEVGKDAQAAIRYVFEQAKLIELNTFGGSPGMNKAALKFIGWAKQNQMRANLTDTGRQFLINPDFVNDFLADPPHVLALSFDDLTPTELKQLYSCSYQELRDLWNKSMKEEPYHGQKHKAYEGVYTGKLVTEKLVTGKANPQILVMFNAVIHPGNIDHMPELVETIASLMPRSRLNLYPAQSSFDEDPAERIPCWEPEHLPKLEKNTQWLREETLAGNPNLTARLHYYHMLLANFDHFRDEPHILCERMSGFDTWRPDRRPGALRYSEISGSATEWGNTAIDLSTGRSKKSVLPSGSKIHPGGHPMSSYWYQWTVDGGKQLHEYSPEELAKERLTGKIPTLPEHTKAFRGHIMPRLTYINVSTELGMNAEVLPHYLKYRRQDFGY